MASVQLIGSTASCLHMHGFMFEAVACAVWVRVAEGVLAGDLSVVQGQAICHWQLVATCSSELSCALDVKLSPASSSRQP